MHPPDRILAMPMFDKAGSDAFKIFQLHGNGNYCACQSWTACRVELHVIVRCVRHQKYKPVDQPYNFFHVPSLICIVDYTNTCENAHLDIYGFPNLPNQYGSEVTFQ